MQGRHGFEVFEEMRRRSEALAGPFAEIAKLLDRDRAVYESLARQLALVRLPTIQELIPDTSALSYCSNSLSDVAKRSLEASRDWYALQTSLQRPSSVASEFELMQSYSETLKSDWASLRAVTLPMVEQLQQISRGLQLPLSSFVESFSSDLARLDLSAPEKVGFAKEWLDRLSAVSTAETDEELGGAVEEAGSWIESGVQYSPRFQVDLMALLSLFVTLVVFAYQKVDGDSTKTQIQKSILDSEARVISALQAASDGFERPLFAFAARPTRLRSEPSNKSSVLRVLPPGTPMQVLQRTGRWSGVRVFDVTSGTSEFGWVFQRRAPQQAVAAE